GAGRYGTAVQEQGARAEVPDRPRVPSPVRSTQAVLDEHEAADRECDGKRARRQPEERRTSPRLDRTARPEGGSRRACAIGDNPEERGGADVPEDVGERPARTQRSSQRRGGAGDGKGKKEDRHERESARREG